MEHRQIFVMFSPKEKLGLLHKLVSRSLVFFAQFILSVFFVVNMN